jgi:hypothetical protein
VVNLALRNYISWLARVLPRIRHFDVTASSREVDDLRAAFSAKRLLRSELLGHRGTHVDEILRLLSFAFTCHRGWALVEGVKEKDEETGEVTIKALSPDDVLTWPGVQPMLSSPYIAVRQRMTGPDLERRWGIKVEKLSGAEWDGQTGMNALQPGIKDSLYTVVRLFVLPCKMYPNGRQSIMVDGDRVIHDIKKDKKFWIGTPDNKYPLVPIADVPQTYMDFSESRMRQLQVATRAFNLTFSRYYHTISENPVVTWLIPSTGGVTADDILGHTVAVQTYRGQTPPKPQVMPGLEPLVNAMMLFKGLVDELHSQSPVSRGKSQGSRMPVGTTERLIARAESQDYAFIERVRDGMAAIAERYLIEGQAVWGKKRVFKTLGSHRRFEAGAFYTAKLGTGFSVFIKPEDGLPKTMEARWERVTKGLQAQLFGPSEDPKTSERARKLLEVLDDEDELSYLAADDQRAYEHFLKIKNGEPVVVSVFDNHRAHIVSEARYAVDEMAATGDDLGEKIEKDLQLHRKEHIIMQQQINADELALDQLPEPTPEEQAKLVMQQQAAAPQRAPAAQGQARGA